MTAIVARERSLRRAARVGALWGVGHTLTLLAVGGAIIVFRVTVPPRVGLALEFSVALMLILLGFANLRARNDAPAESAALRPFVVGLVHGLAGSAAVALLVLATIRTTVACVRLPRGVRPRHDRRDGDGDGAPRRSGAYAGPRVTRFNTGIRVAAGALSIAFGLVLARALIVDGGLFSATSIWAPH